MMDLDASSLSHVRTAAVSCSASAWGGRGGEGGREGGKERKGRKRWEEKGGEAGKEGGNLVVVR